VRTCNCSTIARKYTFLNKSFYAETFFLQMSSTNQELKKSLFWGEAPKLQQPLFSLSA
jgi:hypothetical protein